MARVPLALTQEQLNQIMQMALPIPRDLRTLFLEMVAQQLSAHPGDGEESPPPRRRKCCGACDTRRHNDEVNDMDTKNPVVLPHGKNTVAIPVYSIGYTLGPDGQCQPGDPIGYRIGLDGRPEQVIIGFVVALG